MKSILFFATAILISLQTVAQVEKGKVLIGGGFNYNTEGRFYSKYSDTYVEINPRVGYFIAKNLAIGINAGYNYSFSVNSNGKDEIHEVYGGPIIRYYKMIGKQFAFLGQASCNYTALKSYTLYTSHWYNNYRNKGFDVAIKPGFVYFPSPKFGIELLFGNIGYTYLDESGTFFPNTSKEFNMSFDLRSLSLGLFFYLH